MSTENEKKIEIVDVIDDAVDIVVENVEKNGEIVDTYIDVVYDALCDIIKTKKLTIADTAIIVLSLMKIVEGFDNLTGTQKKKILLTALEKYDSLHPDEANLVSAALEGFINAFVQVEKGDIVIGVKKGGNCLTSCFGCVMSVIKSKK